MARKTLDLYDLITPDQMALDIANKFHSWRIHRREKEAQWDEVRRFVFATDTSTTSNSKLPWKNSTTLPKLCQIRDNLKANYMATIFPKRRWLVWEGDDEESEDKAVKSTIEEYMAWVIERSSFKKVIEKLIDDYIDYGNAIATVEWEDNRVDLEERTQVGYVGPVAVRVSPLDIVFNPIASSFEGSPKIVRTLLSLGEIKEYLTRMSIGEENEEYLELYNYLKEIRSNSKSFTGDLKYKDDWFHIDGFDSYRAYLDSNYVEVLTFTGDLYDAHKDEFLRNHVITIVDRHKLISKKPNPSFFGHPPIFHTGWRKRQDNLWAMGPLDNLVGMQYRIDHLENLKADVFDLIALPPLKIRGYVEDFEWGPMERIYVGDEGDVEMVSPDVQALQADMQIQLLEQKMEEMAGAPKEAMGFRTPGEKTMYEVQSLENAASRVFQAKIAQFEEEIVEPLLNAMLELARRKITSGHMIRVFDDEFKIAEFKKLTPETITGQGRIRPLAARHFAEKAQVVQNLNAFFSSPLGQQEDIMLHWSGIRTSEMFEELLDVQDYNLVEPYIRLSERADAQRQSNVHQENVMMEAQTPSGLTPDDYDA